MYFYADLIPRDGEREWMPHSHGPASFEGAIAAPAAALEMVQEEVVEMEVE